MPSDPARAVWLVAIALLSFLASIVTVGLVHTKVGIRGTLGCGRHNVSVDRSTVAYIVFCE